MTVFAVSGMRPAKSDAERARQEFQVVDTVEEAMSVGETWLRQGVVDVSVWEQTGIPTLRTIVDWEKRK